MTMENVTSTVTSIISMMTSVFNFITSNPLLLAFIAIPLVGGVIFLVTSIFRGK